MSATLASPSRRLRLAARGGADLAIARHLSRELMAAGTPSQALLAWCRERRIGEGEIRAVSKPHAAPQGLEEDLLDALGLAAGEELRRRDMVLMRGDVAIADCSLWWLPGRLSPPATRELDRSEQPFRLLTPALRPARRTVLERFLPEGGRHLLEHHALLLADGAPRRPRAAVRELYRLNLAGRAG